MKKIVQLRYFGEGNENNVPKDNNIWAGGNLLRNFGNVSHLGIQGEPGIKFYLNNRTNPIYIGNTGIYELNLEGLGYITGLYFDKQNLNEKYAEQKDRHMLIVDFVYNSAEV